MRAPVTQRRRFSPNISIDYHIQSGIVSIIWIPKYRRKEFYGEKRRVVVETIKQWDRIKGIDMLEGHAMPDHIHLCASISTKYAVANPLYCICILFLDKRDIF